MNPLRVMFLFVIVAVACLPYSARALGASSSGPSCTLADGKITISFGTTKPPTHAAVIDPDSRFIYLRYQPMDVDVLGDSYRDGKVDLSVSGAYGYIRTGDVAQRYPLFTTPGIYKFLFQDANTAMGMDVHSLECAVHVSDSDLATRHWSNLPESDCPMAGAAVIGGPAYSGGTLDLPVGCNYVGSCAGRPCCNKAAPWSPCYCSLCCYAAPTPTAVASK